MQKLIVWAKENISKKLLITLAMFLLGPYLAKARANGWDVSDDMVRTLLEGMFASGSVYVLVQGVKDWVGAHHEGKAATAAIQNAAFPESTPKGVLPNG